MSSIRTPLTVSPHEYFGDITGRPLDYGTIYFGEPDKDPEFYPIDVYADEALTQPIPQPIRTKGGFINVNGDMIEIYGRPAIYSVKVLDQYGRKIFYKGKAMRNNANDDIIAEIDAAIKQSKEDGVEYAKKVVRQAIDETVTDNSPIADTLIAVDGSLSQRTINKGLESIADLSTIKNPKDGLRVYVKSYYEGLNKGGGYFVYDESETKSDDVIYFKAGNGAWVRVQNDYNTIDAVDAGVVFDGETDNTEAFNRACGAMRRGMTLKLSSGIAKTHSFTLPNHSCTLTGVGFNASKIKLIDESDSIGWNEYNFFSHFAVAGVGYYSSSILFRDMRADNNTRTDCDVQWDYCYFSDAKYITDGFGRGFIFNHCVDCNIKRAWVKADMPSNHVPNGADNDTPETGFRGFIFNDNRRHYSPAYFIENLGSQAEKIQGIQINNTQLEGGGRFVQGYMRDAIVTGTIGYHRNADWKYFELTGGKNINITGNTFAKMHDSDVISGEFLTSNNKIENLNITNNLFDGIDKSIVKLDHADTEHLNINIKDNTYSDCFKSNDPIFRIDRGSVRRLTVIESGIAAPSNNWFGVSRGESLAVYDYVVDIQSTSNYIHNLPRGTALHNTRKQGVYVGDATTKTIVIGYEPMIIRVQGSDGTTSILPHGTVQLANGISMGSAQNFTVSGNANKTGVTYFWETC